MAFRDENEALQAKVAGLQEELRAANATITDLQGDPNFAKPDLLPKRIFGFKRRVRTIGGHVDTDVYDEVVQMLQSDAKAAMKTGLVGRILTAKSRRFHVTVLPGEGDELLVVFDEYRTTNYALAFILFIFMSMASLGAALDATPGLGLAVFVIGALMTTGAAYFSKKGGEKEQARRDELFANVGGLLQRNATKVRVAEEDLSAEAEVEVQEDVALENEK